MLLFLQYLFLCVNDSIYQCGGSSWILIGYWRNNGWFGKDGRSKPLPADSPGQQDVAAHQGHAMGVVCAQVGILEQRNDGGFCGLLEGQQSVALEPELGLEVEILNDLTDLVKGKVLLRWKGAFCIKSSVLFWYLLIYLRAAFPGLDLLFFFTPVSTGAVFLAIFWVVSFFFSWPTFSVVFLVAFERTISW